MTKLQKRVGAWVVLDVVDMEPMSIHLTRVIGPIVESNFLKETDDARMPVIREAFDLVKIGDRVKLLFFTTKNELEGYRNRKSIGFSDKGFKYFRWLDNGWELIYDG